MKGSNKLEREKSKLEREKYSLKVGYQARKGEIKLDSSLSSWNLQFHVKKKVNLKASKIALNLKFKVKKNKLNQEEQKHIQSLIWTMTVENIKRFSLL